MTALKFGHYVHSDAVTPAKGAAVAAVSGGGDFATLAARYAYAADAADWAGVSEMFPDVEATRADLGADIQAVASLRLLQGQAGRVAVAAVGDFAAVARTLCVTDFAAKTEGFRDFAARVADAAARHGNRHWGTLVALETPLESERKALERVLRERIEVSEIVLLRL